MQQPKKIPKEHGRGRGHFRIFLWGDNLAKFDSLKEFCRKGFDYEGRGISDANLLRALIAYAPMNVELKHQARARQVAEKETKHIPHWKAGAPSSKGFKAFSCTGRLLKRYYKLQAFCTGSGKRIPGVVIIRTILMSVPLVEEFRSYVHTFCAEENQESAAKYRKTFHQRLKEQTRNPYGID